MQETMTERRETPRVPTALPVVMQAAGTRQVAQVRNISRNGICCMVPQRITEMTRLHIEMDLPLAGRFGHVRGAGVVVRCQDSGKPADFEIAVLFTDLDAESRLAVNRYVSAQRTA